MKLDKRKSILNTSVGCHITIIAYIVILMYTLVKFNVWIEKKDISIMATKLTDALPDGYTFSYEQGLNIAIAFTGFDNNIEPILDKSYGHLVFKEYAFGKDEEGKYYTRSTEIPSHTCTDEELGYSGNNAAFYPINE